MEIQIKNKGRLCSTCAKHLKQSPTVRLRALPTILILYSITITLIVLRPMISTTSVSQVFFPKAKNRISRYPYSLYTPLGHGIEYKTQNVAPDAWHNDIFMGNPSDESERAWKKLIHPNRQHGIRLYRDEALRLGINESVLLPDNNFAVILTVHHNLHCLRRLRQTFYADHYYPTQTQEEKEHDRAHSLHCLESLRASILCQPDIAPLPYYWSGNQWHDMNASPAVKRECVNWDVFSEYLMGRRYEKSELVR